MEIYPSCTSEDFKTDLEHLCTRCPLKSEIEKEIENQIIFQANERKSILSKELFIQYLLDEIKSASDAMERQYLLEQQQRGNYRESRIKTYIWNKERIKALNQFLAPSSSPKQKNYYTYEWLGKADEDLPQLHRLMKKFIGLTTITEFKKIFLKTKINEKLKPIKWHENKASEVLYFISKLMEKGLIKDQRNRFSHKMLKSCFAPPDGNIFTQRLKQLKNNLPDNVSKSSQEELVEIIEKLT